MEGKPTLYLRANRFSFWITKLSSLPPQGSVDHLKGGYVRGLWMNMFLNCKGSARKSLAGHLLRDDSRLEEDVQPARRRHAWAFAVIG